MVPCRRRPRVGTPTRTQGLGGARQVGPGHSSALVSCRSSRSILTRSVQVSMFGWNAPTFHETSCSVSGSSVTSRGNAPCEWGSSMATCPSCPQVGRHRHLLRKSIWVCRGRYPLAWMDVRSILSDLLANYSPLYRVSRPPYAIPRLPHGRVKSLTRVLSMHSVLDPKLDGEVQIYVGQT